MSRILTYLDITYPFVLGLCLQLRQNDTETAALMESLTLRELPNLLQPGGCFEACQAERQVPHRRLPSCAVNNLCD